MFSILGFIRKTHEDIDAATAQWLKTIKDDTIMYPRDGYPALAVVPPARPRGAHRKD